jgi:ammonia channel protein AmtB
MIGLLCFFLAVLASPFKSKLRLEAENARDIVSDIGKGGIGNPNPLAPTIPETVYICFQMTFAIITPALIAGAFAERMKFSAMLWFIGLWAIFVYAPIAHWVWSPSSAPLSFGLAGSVSTPALLFWNPEYRDADEPHSGGRNQQHSGLADDGGLKTRLL